MIELIDQRCRSHGVKGVITPQLLRCGTSPHHPNFVTTTSTSDFLTLPFVYTSMVHYARYWQWHIHICSFCFHPGKSFESCWKQSTTL